MFVLYVSIEVAFNSTFVITAGAIIFESFMYIFYRTQVSLGSDLWVLMYLTPRLCADLTDVTLADDDSN